MDGFKFELTALVDFQKELAELPKLLQAKIVRGAAAAGAEVIRAEAVRLAPIAQGFEGPGMAPPGTLKRAIYKFRIPEKSGPTNEYWKVSVLKGDKETKGSLRKGAYYAAWVEFGHYARQPKSAGKRKQRQANQKAGLVKFVPPHPFMRPAFENSKERVNQAMRDYIDQQLPVAALALKYFRAQGGR